MAKNKKQVLNSVNQSMDILDKIHNGHEFTNEEKSNILTDYVGVSKDNNSYFTPIQICEFIHNAIGTNGKVADFSGGIGNMIVPLIEEYGKLKDGIQFDLYELDKNTSTAAKKAWEDYDQVNIYGEFDSLQRADEIEDYSYNFIVGNPPFSGSTPYLTEWDYKAMKSGNKAKNINLADAFVDLSIKKLDDDGYLALVLPMGHLYKDKSTKKLREWIKKQVVLKAIIPLDSKTFEDAGLQGTGIPTVLCIFQSKKEQETVFYGELYDTDNLEDELKSLAEAYRLFDSGEYEVRYESEHTSGLHGVLYPIVKPWEVEY